jgi:nucleolar protein 15
VSRNKKTGKSKHFAFIEFAEESTVSRPEPHFLATVTDARQAHIAAKTMDKYLLFGHILTVKFVGKDQLNANVWKGANKRFKQIPWNKIAGNKLARPLTEEAWEERNAKETKRRADRAEKLKAIGYEFEAPALKAAPAPAPVEAVEEKKPEAVEEAPAVEAPAAEEAPVVEETVVETTVTEEVVEETPKSKKGKAGKKGKKAKA